MTNNFFLLAFLIIFIPELYAKTEFKKTTVTINKDSKNKILFSLSVPNYKYPLIFTTKEMDFNIDCFNDKRPFEPQIIGEKECEKASYNNKLLVPSQEGLVTEINNWIKVEYPKIYYSLPKKIPLKSFTGSLEFPLVFPNGSFVVKTLRETEIEAQGYCYRNGEYDPQGTGGIRNASGDPNRRLFNHTVLEKTYRVFLDEKNIPNFCLSNRYEQNSTIVLDKNGNLVKDNHIRQ